MNYKTILVAMFIMAMALIGPSVAATGNELMRIYTCDSEVIDFMEDEPGNIIEFVGLDYSRGNLIIDTGGNTYVTQYGEKIAILTELGCGVFEITPLNKGKVYVYYKVATESGKTYTRFLNLGVSSYCMEQVCDGSTYFNQGAMIIYTPVEGEWLDTDRFFPGNGEMTTEVRFDGGEPVTDWTVPIGTTCIEVTMLVDGVPYARNGITI